MNTIVNITGLTLKNLETSDESAIRKAKKREYHKKWYLKNKQHKKEYDIKYRKEIYNKIRRERIKNDPEYRKKINEARNEYG